MRIQLLLAVAALGGGTAAWALVRGGLPESWASLAVVVAARAAATHIFRLDRLLWRDWGRDDGLIWTASALSGGMIAFLAAGAVAAPLPASVAIVETLLYLQVGSAAALRGRPGRPKQARKRALIYGAGGQGRLLLRELRRDGGPFEPIGWLDDDPDKAETVLAGLPVLGPIRSLPFVAELYGAEAVFTAISGLTAEQGELAAEMAQMADVRLYVLPTVRDALLAVQRSRIAA